MRPVRSLESSYSHQYILRRRACTERELVAARCGGSRVGWSTWCYVERGSRAGRCSQRSEGLSMSEENKAVVRQFFAEVINGGNFDPAPEPLTADSIQHPRLPRAGGRPGTAAAPAVFSLVCR